jgi:hypothetical protein
MWNLLSKPEDWEAHKKETVERFGLTGGVMAWGDGPKEYPCLAGSVPSSRGNQVVVVSAYVYVADAQNLLRAAGASCQGGESSPSPQQDQFNRWVAAYMMTMAYFCRETGLFKPEPFEEQLAEALKIVNETAEARKAALENRDPQDATMLDRLRPSG